jgi:hypothetical protein
MEDNKSPLQSYKDLRVELIKANAHTQANSTPLDVIEEYIFCLRERTKVDPIGNGSTKKIKINYEGEVNRLRSCWRTYLTGDLDFLFHAFLYLYFMSRSEGTTRD